MKIYTVHLNTKNPAAVDRAVFLKEGFSLFAFMFHGFWLLYHRMWLKGAIIMAVFILLGILETKGIITVVHSSLIQLGLQAYLGYAAPDWLRESLEKKGYSFAGVVSGKDGINAQQRFFDRYTQRPTAPEGLPA